MTILHFLRFSIFRWRTDWESTPYPKPPPWSTFRWHHFVLPVTVFDFLCFFFTLLTSTALLSPQLPPSSSIFLYSRPLGIDTENFYLLCKWMGATDSKTRIWYVHPLALLSTWQLSCPPVPPLTPLGSPILSWLLARGPQPSRTSHPPLFLLSCGFWLFLLLVFLLSIILLGSLSGDIYSSFNNPSVCLQGMERIFGNLNFFR